MDYQDRILGRRVPLTPDGQFDYPKLAATFLEGETGKLGAFRERTLDAAEKFRLITAAQRDTASGGAAELGPNEGFVTQQRALAGATTIAESPAAGVHGGGGGGLYGQLLQHKGFSIPAAQPEVLSAPPSTVPEAVSDAPAAASTPAEVPTPVAAAASEVAERNAALQNSLEESFRRLAALDPVQYNAALARTVDAGAAAGHGDDALMLLTRAVAEQPLEHSAPALRDVIDRIIGSAAAPATPVTDDALRYGLPGAKSLGKSVSDMMKLLARV